MHKTDCVAQTQKIPPLYIAIRHSTNFAAVVDEDIGRTVRFVGESMGTHCTLEQIAAYVGLSKRTLIRRFHSIFGHPPEQEIFPIRLNRAKELLIETELPVNQIAHNIGYRSTDYFVRMFRYHVGMTPLLFRQQRGCNKITFAIVPFLTTEDTESAEELFLFSLLLRVLCALRGKIFFVAIVKVILFQVQSKGLRLSESDE